jgi:acyl-CoA thioesterase-1
VLCLALVCGQVRAQEVKIVAVGTSMTAGHYVPNEQIFAHKLEELLRAQGVNAQVRNEGVNGDSSRQILARLDHAVPDGTSVAILDVSAGNDELAGISGKEYAQNSREMISRLRARKIQVVRLVFGCSSEPTEQRCKAIVDRWRDFDKSTGSISVPIAISSDMLVDGRHLSAEGHAKVAAMLVAPVKELLARVQAGGG